MEVGDGVGGEVEVAVGGEEGAVELALGEGGEDVAGGGDGGGAVELRGGAGSRKKEGFDGAGDGGGGGAGLLVGEDGDGDVVVGEDGVLGDEAADLSGVGDLAVAVEAGDVDREAVVRAGAVFELDFGFEGGVAGGLEEGLVDDAEVPGEEVA